jgi:ABC-type nitrate/sulfonate/bicarbonate transport system substrate-binding protein
MKARRVLLTHLLHRAGVFLGTLAILLLCAIPNHAADKLRVSNCYIGGGILPLWMAKDAGYYEQEGLDVEQIWIQGNPATAALIAGEIDMLHCIPHNTIGAMAGGADLLFVASIYNRMQYRIVAGQGVERMEQLRGKTVGVARVHDVAHFYLRLALKPYGMTDKDIRIAAVGGQNDRVLALKNGRVAATILNPANALVMEQSGFKTILIWNRSTFRSSATPRQCAAACSKSGGRWSSNSSARWRRA